jgi:hypothetical protein
MNKKNVDLYIYIYIGWIVKMNKILKVDLNIYFGGL